MLIILLQLSIHIVSPLWRGRLGRSPFGSCHSDPVRWHWLRLLLSMFHSIWFGSVSDWKILKNLALASSVLWTRSSRIPLRVYDHWVTILLDRLEMCSGRWPSMHLLMKHSTFPRSIIYFQFIISDFHDERCPIATSQSFKIVPCIARDLQPSDDYPTNLRKPTYRVYTIISSRLTFRIQRLYRTILTNIEPGCWPEIERLKLLQPSKNCSSKK